MKAATQHHIQLGGKRVDYLLVASRTARKLRVRVGPNGVEVVRPASREVAEVAEFLRANSGWIANQLERVKNLRTIRRPDEREAGEILFHGEPTTVRVESHPNRRGANRVTFGANGIVMVCGRLRTSPATSLENWLRRQARAEITKHLAEVTRRLKRVPNKVYVMGQRTKWGNCSAMQNLSFNWRLIMAPPFVLRYLVTHEAVHLVAPDHSTRFWLLLQSLCPDMERAKQWLSTHGQSLFKAILVVNEKRGIDPTDLVCESSHACFVREQG